VFRWMGKIRMKTWWGNAHMGGGMYTQIFTHSCENGMCACIGSVGTYDWRNTDSGTWGHKCEDIRRQR